MTNDQYLIIVDGMPPTTVKSIREFDLTSGFRLLSVEMDAPYDHPPPRALKMKFGKPVRLPNDADRQGLAAIQGKELELVLTLGTSAGSGLFRNGGPMPHLELAHQMDALTAFLQSHQPQRPLS